MKTFKNIAPLTVSNLTDFVVHSGRRISSKALVDTEQTEVRFFSAAAGEDIDKEIYTHESLIVCLAGQIKIVYNDADEALLTPGQMIALDAGVPYGMVAVTDAKYYSILMQP